jgi:hypothetical protein
MNKKLHIDKLVEEAMDSIDDIRRASPPPFLLTRVNARLNKAGEARWEKLVRLIGRPAFAIPALATLMLINVTVVVLNRPAQVKADQLSFNTADEFSTSVASIYDIENAEP